MCVVQGGLARWSVKEENEMLRIRRGSFPVL